MFEIFNTALMISLSTVLTLIILILLIRVGGCDITIIIADEDWKEIVKEISEELDEEIEKTDGEKTQKNN